MRSGNNLNFCHIFSKPEKWCWNYWQFRHKRKFYSKRREHCMLEISYIFSCRNNTNFLRISSLLIARCTKEGGNSNKVLPFKNYLEVGKISQICQGSCLAFGWLVPSHIPCMVPQALPGVIAEHRSGSKSWT